jgi:AraC family transcriptional regulator, positive regulator of tynA and feaB
MSAVTWSTAAVPRSRQFGYWREMICEAFLDLSPETAAAGGAGRDGFRGRVTQRQLGRLAIAQIGSQAQRVRRTESDIARSPRAGYYANLQLRGSCRTVQDGRAAVTQPGDLTVVNTERPFAFELSDDFAQLSFYVPGQLLHPQLEQPVRTATRIPTVTGVGAALRHALQALEPGSLPEDSASRLAVHAGGLLAVALNGPADPGPGARRRAGQLDAALADVAEHLADDDLCPATTAGRLGISVRQLHQVFAGHGRTFGNELRRQRLEQARRDLADPARAGLRVIDIAADAGFADVTHFHRVFRQAYGCTPAQLRRGQAG